ncbi:hypothetical protein [Nitrospira sp. KM1]|uniref:hypothetical protein n=1 Tax=Nitrospira sp. KM1 TaxID=1936990 RepID=UPI0015669F48|nr:hypothetical protein [Nitrospira sp. KM1]
MEHQKTWDGQSAHRHTLFQAAPLGDQQTHLRLEREFHVRMPGGWSELSPAGKESRHA